METKILSIPEFQFNKKSQIINKLVQTTHAAREHPIGMHSLIRLPLPVRITARALIIKLIAVKSCIEGKVRKPLVKMGIPSIQPAALINEKKSENNER